MPWPFRRAAPVAIQEAGADVVALREQARQLEDTLDLFQERIAELEIGYEDSGFSRLTGEGKGEFSRAFLGRIIEQSRLYALKNPLINRAVTLQAQYVWGQGVTVKAAHPDVDAVIQRFWADPKNQVELTGHQARTGKEVQLRVEGNLFFVFFVHPVSGHVRLRTIPVDEIQEIVCNPQDRKDPWFYRRTWMEGTARKEALYPDWRHRPDDQPTEVEGKPVPWNTPVYHVKVGGLPDMRFGVPETYQGLDWAGAYKSFLEDWHSLVKALTRFAWQLQVKGGSSRVAAAKSRLQTTVSAQGGTAETNPPPVTGATFISGDGAQLSPIRTSGVAPAADDARRSLLMVAAAVGLPETFFGDASVGTLATAKSLDRPTELKFKDAQSLWADVLRDIFDYVIDRAALAPGGPLAVLADVGTNEYGEQTVALAIDPATGEPASRQVGIDFPPILEHSVSEQVDAVVSAATLAGSKPAPTFDPRTTTRLLLQALGVEGADALLDKLHPVDEEGNALPLTWYTPPAPPPALPPGQQQQPPVPTDAGQQTAEAALAEAIRELRAAVLALHERAA